MENCKYCTIHSVDEFTKDTILPAFSHFHFIACTYYGIMIALGCLVLDLPGG